MTGQRHRQSTRITRTASGVVNPQVQLGTVQQILDDFPALLSGEAVSSRECLAARRGKRDAHVKGEVCFTAMTDMLP